MIKRFAQFCTFLLVIVTAALLTASYATTRSIAITAATTGELPLKASVGNLTTMNDVVRSPVRSAVFLSSLRSHSVVTLTPGVISVEATVDITDTIGINGDYLWRVKAFDNTVGSGDLQTLPIALDLPYGTRKFKTPTGSTKSHKFNDLIYLDPGDYVVTIALYRLPDGYNHSLLMLDDRLAKSKQIVSVRAYVTVE